MARMKAPIERSVVKVDLALPQPQYGMELGNFIQQLESALSEVPAEFRATVKCELNKYTDYDCAMADFEAWYYRPETDEEWAARKARHAAQQRHTEESERATLAALQAKYESARQGD